MKRQVAVCFGVLLCGAVSASQLYARSAQPEKLCLLIEIMPKDSFLSGSSKCSA